MHSKPRRACVYRDDHEHAWADCQKSQKGAHQFPCPRCDVARATDVGKFKAPCHFPPTKCTQGYPSWTPQLNIELRETYQLDGLKIGDVGIISPIDASFDVLFNITLPHNEQPYLRL
ncbi:hypothetical protein EV363DRAFT_1554382, partial [Boletus edulis]